MPLLIFQFFFVLTVEELKQTDQKTRKLLAVQKALHPRDDRNRLYVARKEGRWILASFEGRVDASMQEFENYIKMSKKEKDLLQRPEITVRI